MKAVISFSGKQYFVKEGDFIFTDKVDIEPKKKIKINSVLLLAKDEKVIIGKPKISSAFVEMELVETKKDKKVRIIKFRPKKRYQRNLGHRQIISKLKIIKIKA